MVRRLSLLGLASMGLCASPAFAQGAPPADAPPAVAAPSAPAPVYGPPPGYGPPPAYAPGYPPGAYYWPGAYGAPAPPPPQPTTERRSTPMMVTGIVLVGLGVAGLLTGTAVYSSKLGSCVITSPSPDGTFPDRCPDDPSHYIGTTILITSGVVAALGVPLWIFGGTHVPISGEPADAPKPSALRPTLFVGPRSAALHFSF